MMQFAARDENIVSLLNMYTDTVKHQFYPSKQDWRSHSLFFNSTLLS